jgi:diacylglycerol kinase family enzyme
MGHPLGTLVLLVPSKDAAAAEQVDALVRELAKREVDSRVVATAGDPRAAVRRELDAGARLLVHCGGLRSLRPVVIELLRGGTRDPADAVLGLYPGGARNDYARTFGLTLNAAAAAHVLTSPRVMSVDVGVATVQGGRGAEDHYALNGAVVGVGAAAARTSARLRGLGRIGGLLSWWAAGGRRGAREVEVDMTFAEWRGRATQVRVDNGQFALGGLHVSPLALPDDGAWEVQVWDGPRSLPFTLQPKMHLADHLPNPHISQWRQKRVEVRADRPLPVAVDEVYVGTTPATFTLLPGALRLKI